MTRQEWKLAIVCLVVFVGLVALSSCLRQEPQPLDVSVQGYIKDTLTFPYNVAVDKTLSVTGVTTMTGGAYVPGTVSLGGALAVGGVLTLNDGAIINAKGAVTVTDGLDVSGQVKAGNGVLVSGGNISLTTGGLINAQGAVTVSDSAYINGDASINGGLVVSGNVSDNAGSLRLNDNTLVTGTLGVSSQVLAANGVRVTGGVTVASSGDLVLAGGNIWDDSNDVDILDDLQVQGVTTVDYGLSVAGTLTMAGGSLLSTRGAITVSDDLSLAGDFTMNTAGRIVQANGEVTVADGIDITGITYAHDDIQALTDVRISDFLILEDVDLSGIITVTGFITPTRSDQRILAEAWVTPTVNGGCVPGLVWILYNWGSPNICLVDGGSLILAGDWTAGQHDTLMLMCNAGGNWAEIARSNN